MKKPLIILTIMLIAVPALAGADGWENGHYQPLPPDTRIEFKTPPRIREVDSVTIKGDKPCHWTFKIVPEYKLEEWLNDGWTFEKAYTIESGSTNPFKPYEKHNMAIIKRKVCP